MTKELEAYYNTYFDLFRTDGWKQLVNELKDNAIALNSVEGVKDENDLYFKKGQIAVLANLVNLETTITNAFEEINSDAEAV
jgi:chaperonin cofactor prefoldin